MIFTECEDFDLDENTCEINEKQNEDIQALQDTDIRHNEEIKSLQKKDHELDKKISNVMSKAIGNEAAIVGVKADVNGLITQISNAQSDISEIQTDLDTTVSGLEIRDNELENKINSLSSSISSNEVIAESLKSDNAEITNLTVTNLEQKNIETELIKADSAIIKNTEAASIKANVISGKIHHDVTDSLVNDELFHIFVPNYSGKVNIQAENYELNISIINNTVVTFNQKTTYLHRVEFSNDGTHLYFTIAFDYDELHIGNKTFEESHSDEVDRTFYENNVNTLTGVILRNEVISTESVDFNVIPVDKLPDGGATNVIYIVSGDKSYYCDGEYYYAMTSEEQEDIDFEALLGELGE